MTDVYESPFPPALRLPLQPTFKDHGIDKVRSNTRLATKRKRFTDLIVIT